MNMLFVPKETCPTVLAPWALDALVMGSRFNEPSQMQEIMALSKGFKGVYSEGGQEQSQSMQLHMLFGVANQVEGVGSDAANGEFALSGNYTDHEVFFVLKYHNMYQPSRTFAGTRQKDAQISGRWWAEGGPSGEFVLTHEDAERRFAPSYDVERLKLYYVLERLATGGFGQVSRVRRAVDGKVLVWKELNYARMNKKERRMMITEVNILRDIDHQHVVRYYDTIIVREQQKIYLIIEHCPNGDMGALIESYKKKKCRMEEAFIWRVLGQILLALQSCHNREEVILHRDLKPANILLDEELVVKVADFGLAAVVISDSLACSKVGTPLYMAPEQIQGAGYTAKSDMWALGCIIYEMAALKPPFDANNQMELAGCIREGRFERIPDDYSSDLHRVICWMLQLAQENRPSVEEMLRYIQRVELVKTSVSLDMATEQGSSRQVPPELILKNSAKHTGGVGGHMAQTGPVQTVQQDRIPGARHGNHHGGSAENANNHTAGRERPHIEDRKKEGLGLRLLQNADGVWRVEGLKEDSPAHRSGALFPGDQIKTIQGWEVTGQGWESLGPFLSNLVSTAAASKSDVNILVLRRGPSGDKVIKVALSLEGRSHSETVATHHLQPLAKALGPSRLGSNENAGEGAPSLLSPRVMQGIQQPAPPDGIRSPRVPHLPLANMPGTGPASAREHHAVDPSNTALSPRQQVMSPGRVVPASQYQVDHHRKTTGSAPFAAGFRAYGQQLAPSNAPQGPVRSIGDVALQPRNQQIQRLNLAAAGQTGEESAMQGARAGSVDSNHNGRPLLPMPTDKNGGQVEHLKAQCGSLHDALLASKREVVDMKSRENMFWQKAEDMRQREEAIQRREEAVTRREEQVRQREEAVRLREEGMYRNGTRPS